MIRHFAAAAALALSAPFASAAVLNFDDIVGAGDYAAVPAGYGGLDWSGSSWSVLATEQVPYTAHSGAGRVTLGWGSDDTASTIRFNAPTVFDGAWFAGYTEAAVRFDLYFEGSLVASSTTLSLTDTPAFLDAGWDGAIDTVVVSSGQHAFYVMDDLSYVAAPVPEPGALALMLAGFGIVAGVARRRPEWSPLRALRGPPQLFHEPGVALLELMRHPVADLLRGAALHAHHHADAVGILDEGAPDRRRVGRVGQERHPSITRPPEVSGSERARLYVNGDGLGAAGLGMSPAPGGP